MKKDTQKSFWKNFDDSLKALHFKKCISGIPAQINLAVAVAFTISNFYSLTML